MKIESAIKKAYLDLKQNNIKSALLDSEILMSKVLKKSRDYIILYSEKDLEPKNFHYFKHLIHERSKGKPIAYLVEKKYFWKHEFQVNKNVLIPRPETELMIAIVYEVIIKKMIKKYLLISEQVLEP